MKWLEIMIEVLLNVLMMFSILSLLFVLYISKIETSAYENEINNEINQKMSDALTSANITSKGAIYDNLKIIFTGNPNIDKILESESQNISAVENKWLFITIFMTIAFLLVLFLLFCLMLQFVPGNTISLHRKIGWTFVIYMFVGAVEGLFFYNVARKYVPTAPSTLVNSIIDQLKKW